MPVTSRTKPLKKLTKGMGLYQVFNWPDKAPDKSKPWAVANLQTGDVNGRWHSTREEALAQARALYARLGDKAKVHTEEGIRNAYFFAASTAALVDGSEDGVKWVEAIAPKTYSTPAYGDVVISMDKIDNFVNNVNKRIRGQEIAIDYEHGLDPSKGKKAAGWIRGARKSANGNLELAIDFTETAKEEIAKKEWKYFSLEWDDMWQHPDGILFNDVVMGGALTNRPVAKGLIPINFSEVFSETLVVEDESKELEHSEPGRGDPPPPRTDGDGEDELDREGGWRRTTPPIAEDVFSFTEEKALGYLRIAAKALSEYLDEEPDAEDLTTARGLLAGITSLMDKDASEPKKYSEYTELCLQVKKFFEKKIIEDKYDTTVKVKFTEQEAIGYLTASKAGLVRIHTNAANYLIDEIDRMLTQDFRKRSFNELQALVSKTRNMLRGEDEIDTKSTTATLKGGSTVGELTEKDLRELRNVLDVDDDGKILETVRHKFGEMAALRDAVSASEQERVFAEQYPQFYEQHQQLMDKNRRNDAKAFSESVQPLRKNEGFGLKQTRMGLSTAALETIAEAHMKFAEGRGTLDDFEKVVKGIMNGGVVQFGELGSSGDEDIPEIDTSTAPGVAASRKLFAELVAKVQRENPGMDIIEASNEVAKKHPDLADNYRVTLPA